MKNRIIVVCAADNKYAPYCGAMITSLFHNNNNNEVEVNIISSYFDEDNLKKFRLLELQFNQKINIVEIDKSYYTSLPIGKKFTNISVEAYFRLSATSLFKDYDKVLYLDCDMIVNEDLLPLWNIDINNYAFAGIEDSLSSINYNLKRLGYCNENSYYNSGMGLYNLKFLREFDFERKVNDMIKNHYDLIVYHDQDIINYVCHGFFKNVSIRWNLLDCFLMEKPDISLDRLDDFERWIQNPGIIHFSAKYKPWNTEGFHPYSDVFWKYVKMSPWSDLIPVPRFKGKQAVVVSIK